MLLFLLYLDYEFAKNKTSTSIRDPLLGKDVPFLVFIKNKKLHQEALLLLEGRDEAELCELIERAEEQEKLYAERVERGITEPLTESILLEYLDDRALLHCSSTLSS